MSDNQSDIAFQEVDDDLRQQQLQDLWKRFGKYVIGTAVGIVLAVAGNELYSSYVASVKAENAAKFADTIEAAETAGADAATLWDQVAPNLSEGYAVLAYFRSAAEHLKAGNADAAIQSYDAIAAKSGVSDSYQDLARLLAAMTVLDARADLVDARSRLSVIAAEGRTWAYSAQEYLAMIDLMDGDRASALAGFTKLVSDPSTPEGIRARAEELRGMLEAPIVTGLPSPADAEAALPATIESSREDGTAADEEAGS